MHWLYPLPTRGTATYFRRYWDAAMRAGKISNLRLNPTNGPVTRVAVATPTAGPIAGYPER